MRNITIVVLMGFFSALLSENALATTIETSLRHYQSKNYEQAYNGFLELVELGNSDAIYNIGVMHVRGEYVKKDLLQGYAWVKLAVNYGKAVEDIKNRIGNSFTDENRKSAEAIYSSLNAKYGKSSFVSRYLPTVDKLSSKSFKPARIVSESGAKYPVLAQKSGMSGYVDLQFSIAKDGSTRNHGVLLASSPIFKSSALTTLKKRVYEPATLNGKPIVEYGRTFRVIYRIEGETVDQEDIDQSLEEARVRAVEGGSLDSFSYAYSLSLSKTFFRKDADIANPTPWFIRSAQSGNPMAKYYLGKNALYGNQCDTDDFKSHFWLQKSAEDGLSDAQFILGLEYINGKRYKQNTEVGLDWMVKAAEAGLDHSQLTLAWIFSTHPDEAIRSARKAEKYFAMVNGRKYVDRLSYYETRSALDAAKSNFRAALKWQKKAIKEAKKYELPTDDLLAALARYQSNEALVVEF